MRRSRPFVFAMLMLPFGISNGVATILLPFLLERSQFSVGEISSIVAIALIPNITRSLFAPPIDVFATLHQWYLIGLAICAGTMILLLVLPIRQEAFTLITITAFASQVGANMLAIPVGGLMARTVGHDEQGRAGGWYQAGSLGGLGLGGGLGVWLATRVPVATIAVFLLGGMIAFATAIRFVPRSSPPARASISAAFRGLGSDLVWLVRSPEALLITLMVMSPLGAGAVMNLWSAVARDWHASADVVAFATGVLATFAVVTGSVAGGWIADRVGRWTAFFAAGVTMSLVAIVMAGAERTPNVYDVGVSLYAFSEGLAYAAFSALALYATGRGAAAATKYAILGSLGNIPVSYTTAFDGWAYDRWGATGMLTAEAILGIAAMAVGIVALRLVRRARSQ